MSCAKPVRRSCFLAAAAVVLPGLTLVGCGSSQNSATVEPSPTMAGAKTNGTAGTARPPTNIPGVDKTTDAVAGVRALRDELAQNKTQADRTMAALNEVVQGQGDLVPSFQKYAASLQDLKAVRKRVTDRIDEMRNKSRDYVVGWEVEVLGVEDLELRRLSDQRRAEVRSDYTRINESLKAAREGYETFEGRLAGLYTALSYDLTPRGVTASTAGVQKAAQDATTYKQKLDAAIAELDRVAGMMTPAGPASRPVGG